MSARAACWSKGDTLVQFTEFNEFQLYPPTWNLDATVFYRWYVDFTEVHLKTSLYFRQYVYFAGFHFETTQCFSRYLDFSYIYFYLFTCSLGVFTWKTHGVSGDMWTSFTVTGVFTSNPVHPFFCPCFQMQLRYICMLQSKLLLASSRHSSKIATKPIVYRSLGWKLHV